MTEPARPPLPPAPGYLASSLRVFDLSLGEMLWSRRTVFMMIVVGAPVVIAVFLRLLVWLGAPIFQDTEVRNGVTTTVRLAGPAIFGLMIWIFYLRFTVPVLGVFYGTSLIADEVEDKTITYLFTRPIPRGAVLVGKYLAYLGCTIFVVLPSIVLVYLLVVPIRGSLGGSFIDLVKDLILLAVGLAVYGALFAFVGAKFKRPILTGLVFIFGWEQAALLFPGYLKRFTVAYYLQGLVPHAMPNVGTMSVVQAIFQENPTLVGSLLGLAAIFAVSLAWGAWTVGKREYVLEQ
jgi:ABC-type transport system involved in multi-copper enzyme maturation permease subunit